MTAAEVLIDRLIDWGVEVIFGLPGDGINGIMEALRTRQEKIRFIQVRHEESAAFRACGYAKYTGKLGVCLATSGPGGIHLLNGLYDAKLDHQPVLAITGLQFHDLIGTRTQQDVALDKLFMDVAVYNERVMGATHVENVVDLACRTALAYRGVAHITIPVDFQEHELKDRKRSKRNVPHHTSDIYAPLPQIPRQSDLQRAADILNEGRKVAILAGQGALHAGDELEEAAEVLGAPIIKALLGKACVPDDSPYTTGGIGLLGTRPSQEAIESCDTVLIVGSGFPYIEFMPKPDQAKGVQIDLDPQQIGLRFPVDVGLIGDSKRALQILMPLLKRKQDRSFLKKAQEGAKEWWKIMEERASRRDKPMKPQLVAWELGKRLSRPGSDVLAIRHTGLHGARSALHDRRADCLSRSAVCSFCRRRRIFDAHGGFCDRCEISATHKSCNHKEQHTWADQMGADGISGKSGIWSRSSTDRLCRICSCLRRSWVHSG